MKYPVVKNKLKFIADVQRGLKDKDFSKPVCFYVENYCLKYCRTCPLNTEESTFESYPFFKKKTVKNAVYLFIRLHGHHEFYLLDLIGFVRKALNRPYLTDGTITRKLRELREDNLINYEVIDKQRAIYKIKGV